MEDQRFAMATSHRAVDTYCFDFAYPMMKKGGDDKALGDFVAKACLDKLNTKK